LSKGLLSQGARFQKENPNELSGSYQREKQIPKCPGLMSKRNRTTASFGKIWLPAIFFAAAQMELGLICCRSSIFAIFYLGIGTYFNSRGAAARVKEVYF